MASQRKQHVCLICLKRFSLIEGEDNCSSAKRSVYVPRGLLNSTSTSGRSRAEEDDDGNGTSIPAGDSDNFGGGNGDLYSRFLLFVNRHLRLITTSEGFLSLAEELRRRDGEEEGKVKAFCDACSQLVSYICDLYRELETVKLYLIWKLEELGTVMRGSTKKVSKKLAKGLFTQVTNQINGNSVRQVTIFRKVVQVKCLNAGRASTPKISISRGLFPDEWKFTYAATKSMLVNLIVVFLLASSHVHPNQENKSIETGVDRSPKKAKRSQRQLPLITKKATTSSVTTVRKISVIAEEDEIKREIVNQDEPVSFGDEQEDYDPPDEFGNDSDSEWSRGAASPMSAESFNSEVQDDPKPRTRGRKRRRSAGETGQKTGNSNEDCSDDNASNLKIHREAASKKPELQCPKCPRKLIDSRGLVNHLRSIHRTFRGYSCPKCGMRFKLRTEMLEHLTSNHPKYRRGPRGPYRPRKGKPPVEFKCRRCSQLFLTCQELELHQKAIHAKYIGSKSEKILRFIECRICFQGLRLEGRFQRHMRRHEENTFQVMDPSSKCKYFCDHETCPEAFESIPDLNEHLKAHHLEPNSEPNLCKICGMAFLRPYSLTLHQVLHTPRRESGAGFDCPKCGRNCRFLETLITHYDLEHGEEEKPFKCGQCKKHFSNAVWFKIHLKIHEAYAGVEFICDICGKQCVNAGGLITHRRIHDSKTRKKPKETVLGEVLGRVKPFSWKLTGLNSRLDPASPPRFAEVEEKMSKEETRDGRRIPCSMRELAIEQAMADNWNGVKCELENCGVLFENMYLFRKHLESVHEEVGQDEKNIQCLYCFKRFKFEKTYEVHVRAEHKRKVYAKFLCDEESCQVLGFRTLPELNEHLKNTHLDLSTGKNIYSCPICSWGFVASEQRDLHELLHLEPKDNRFWCPKCSTAFEKIRALQHHFNIKHGRNHRPFKCDECDKAYFDRKSIRKHKRLHSLRKKLDPNVKFVCPECGQECLDERHLQKHRREHNPDNYYSCPFPGCEYKLKNQKSLSRHKKLVHGTGTLWICDLCGKRFCYRNTFEKHKSTHAEGAFKCQVCGIKCKRIDTLRLHMRSKHDVNRVTKHVCPQCGKGFYSDGGLKYHFDSTHKPESEWDWMCPRCGRKFYRKMLWGQHVKNCGREDGGDKIEKKVGGGNATKRRGRKRKTDDEEEEEMSEKSTTGEEDEGNVGEEKNDSEQQSFGQANYHQMYYS